MHTLAWLKKKKIIGKHRTKKETQIFSLSLIQHSFSKTKGKERDTDTGTVTLGKQLGNTGKHKDTS